MAFSHLSFRHSCVKALPRCNVALSNLRYRTGCLRLSKNANEEDESTLPPPHQDDDDKEAPSMIQEEPQNKIDNMLSPDSVETTESSQSALLPSYRFMTRMHGGIAATLLMLVLLSQPTTPALRLQTQQTTPGALGLATKLGGMAGFALAATVSNLLATTAATTTSQRSLLMDFKFVRIWNAGLLGFAGLGLLALPGDAAVTSQRSIVVVLAILMTLARIYTISVAARGWYWASTGKSANHNDDETTSKDVEPKTINTKLVLWIRQMGSKIIRSTQTTLSNILKVQHPKKALFYRNAWFLVVLSMVSRFMEANFQIRHRVDLQKTIVEISSHGSAVARLFFISTLLYSLKEAAEREQLRTTSWFRQLNGWVGAWAMVVHIGQGWNAVSGYSLQRIEMMAFSLPFFLKVLQSLNEEKEENNNKQNNNKFIRWNEPKRPTEQ